jgi:DNA-binding transcriptional LysR family regulator
MSIEKYEVFKVVSEVMNFSKASVILNMSQSAVSKSIKKLEEEFGVLLFIRKKHGVELSRYGETIKPEIISVLNQNRRLENVVNAFNELQTGQLVIGSFSSASALLLPNLIKKFSLKYPNIQVVVREGHYDEIKKWLDDGHVDIALLIEEFLGESEKLYLFTDHVKLLAPKSYKLPKKVSIKTIEDYPFIVSEHYPNPYLSNIFDRFNVKPNTQYVVKTNQTIFAFVEKGLGLALLPESTLFRYDHEFDVISLSETIPRNIYLATHHSNLQIPMIKAFWALNQN